MYRNLQELLLKALRGEEWDLLVAVTNFYGEDLHVDQLRLHINLLCIPAKYRTLVTITDIKDYIAALRI